MHCNRVGTKTGPNYHNRYFALKGQSGTERNEIIARRRGAYASLSLFICARLNIADYDPDISLDYSFGIISQALQLIPGMSMVFECTSIVGAALWAAELERAGEKANDPTMEHLFPDGRESDDVVRKEL